jgi:hypothetical protein
MATHSEPTGTDIPSDVIAKFLAALDDQLVPAAVVSRLRAVLLSDKKPSRKALTDALFLEEPLP